MKVFGLFLLVSLSWNLYSQDFDRQKMDAFFKRLDEKNKLMGSLSIWKSEREIYRNTIGYRDVENNLPSNDSTKYRIGSISKSFTAVIVMQMIEEGKISLNTRLSVFFPTFTNADSISILQMLQHKSGLYNFTSSPAYTPWSQKEKSRQELIDYMRIMGVVFPPGQKFEYSNTNYVLLSLIIEQIEQKPYSEVLAERIIVPLKLKNTYYGNHADPVKNEALSYRRMGKWDAFVETDLSIPLGAGGIVSTSSDLNHFYHALFNGQLVSDSSLKTMTTLEDRFGLGLFASPFYDRQALGHTGGIDGFASSSDYFASDSVFVSLTSNGSDLVLNDVVIGILSILFDREYKIPDYEPVLKVSQKKLDTYVGHYYCPVIGMKINIFRVGDQLIGQAENQSAFPLEPFEKNKFRFEQAGLVMDFKPKDNKFILHQGEKFEFLRE